MGSVPLSTMLNSEFKNDSSPEISVVNLERDSNRKEIQTFFSKVVLKPRLKQMLSVQISPDRYQTKNELLTVN